MRAASILFTLLAFATMAFVAFVAFVGLWPSNLVESGGMSVIVVVAAFVIGGAATVASLTLSRGLRTKADVVASEVRA